jgi:hypothetical protein
MQCTRAGPPAGLRLSGIAFDCKTLRVIVETEGVINATVSALPALQGSLVIVPLLQAAVRHIYLASLADNLCACCYGLAARNGRRLRCSVVCSYVRRVLLA